MLSVDVEFPVSRVLVYRQMPSEGAVAIATALREAGINAKKMSREPRRWYSDDVVIGWGDCYPDFDGRSLNNKPPINKLQEITLLRDAGVATVEVSLTPQEGWLPRVSNHHGGNDLLTTPARPAFWVRKEPVVQEFRVHVFGGLSIRAGVKLPRVDNPHPWVRSYDGGWYIDYGKAEAYGFRNRMRDIAKSATQAVGLDFAAVDVGVREDGSVLVFELNRAPGVEGGSVTGYTRHIIDWLNQ